MYRFNRYGKRRATASSSTTNDEVIRMSQRLVRAGEAVRVDIGR
jgi:hypothetical protein